MFNRRFMVNDRVMLFGVYDRHRIQYLSVTTIIKSFYVVGLIPAYPSLVGLPLTSLDFFMFGYIASCL